MTWTSAQIEAAATAIHRVFANRSGRARAWERIPDVLKDEYRAEAKAALDAAIELNETPRGDLEDEHREGDQACGRFSSPLC
jgi:hypothetical protein